MAILTRVRWLNTFIDAHYYWFASNLKGLNVFSNQSGSFACAARAAVASAGGCTFFQEEVNYSNAVSTA